MDGAGRRLLVEHTSDQGGVILRQPLGQRQGQREHVLGHRLRVGAGVRGNRHAVRDLFERDLIHPCRQQLNQAGRAQVAKLLGTELGVKHPGQHRIRRRQRRLAPALSGLAQIRDLGDSMQGRPDNVSHLRIGTECDECSRHPHAGSLYPRGDRPFAAPRSRVHRHLSGGPSLPVASHLTTSTPVLPRGHALNGFLRNRLGHVV